MLPPPPQDKKPGWLGSQRQPAPPSCSPTMVSPRDYRPWEEQHPAGCARKGLANGKESATSLPQPRPHLGSAGGSARPAPGSSESGPPPYALQGPPAGLVARAAPRPEAIRPGGVVRVGPTQEGRVTVAQGQAMEFRLALPSLLCFSFFPAPGEMGQVSALSLSYILQPFTLIFLPRKRGNCTPLPTPGPAKSCRHCVS